jgi:hypothetical protein
MSFVWRAERHPMRKALSLEVLSMLKNLALVFGLLAGLSACAAPYGYPGYGYPPGYGYAEPPAYSGYGSAPAPTYYGPDYPHISQHGTVQP